MADANFVKPMTIKDMKKLLELKREDDIICINGMIIDYATFNNEHGVNNVSDMTVYSANGELSKENVRKIRLRAAGVVVK